MKHLSEIIFDSSRQSGLYLPVVPVGYSLESDRQQGQMESPVGNPSTSSLPGRGARTPLGRNCLRGGRKTHHGTTQH